MSAGSHTLMVSWEERQDGVFRVFSPGGDGHSTALLNAVRGNYNRLLEREQPTEEDLALLDGKKVTLIQWGENALGGGVLKAEEGTIIVISDGQIALLPKGVRSKGWRINPDKVLDVLPGYCAGVASERVAEVRSYYPELREITPERLREVPTNSNTISMCTFGTWALPDCTATDAVQLIHEYLPSDDIVESVLLIRPQHGFSEHGSCYGRQIMRSFGEVVGFKSISLSEAMDLCNMDFDEAVAQIMPERPHAPVAA